MIWVVFLAGEMQKEIFKEELIRLSKRPHNYVIDVILRHYANVSIFSLKPNLDKDVASSAGISSYHFRSNTSPIHRSP